MDLIELRDRVREVLRTERYGLVAKQIKAKGKLAVPTSLIGQVCYWDAEIERLNGNARPARWRLRRLE